MKYLGEDVAKARGLANERGYTSGAWMTWNDDNTACVMTVTAVFNDETECLRWAVANEQSVAFVPYGQDVRAYIAGSWPDPVDIPPG